MFGITNPIAIKLAEYLIVIAIVFGAFYYVYEKGYSACESAELIKQARADKAQQEKYDKVAADYETLKNMRQQNVNTITHEITRITEKPIYNVQCIDSDGRMLINDALAGRKYSGSTNAGVSASSTP